MSVVYHNIVKKTTQILHKTPARIYVIFAGLRKNLPYRPPIYIKPQRNAADNDDDLWLCADGCTHHRDHLFISLRAVLCAAGRGVALEALGVGEELAGRLGAAVRCRDGVALAVIAVGLRRFLHEADVREVRIVGVVVIGTVDRDVFDHQATLLRDDDARRILPVREVVVEAHVLLFNRHDLHFTPLAK